MLGIPAPQGSFAALLLKWGWVLQKEKDPRAWKSRLQHLRRLPGNAAVLVL